MLKKMVMMLMMKTMCSRPHDQIYVLHPMFVTLQENSGILTDIPTENEILGIYRGISEEIPRKHKIGVPRKKTDEFRGNIIAVGVPLGDFTKFRGNSDELAFSVGIPSEFPRYVGRI
ncbi:hypothetical protein F2Q69_00034201 [Brassica cretica]|uniref:Uncharacterized protein n=1 Tax=Brassica cretica TaxID=69181 RepID=A0A8S9SPY5_BRACR|nr:hypothetical protein F2Q69_00034201 [Brassica cretica]